MFTYFREMKNYVRCLVLLLLAGCANASLKIQPGTWRATLTREDGKLIPFTFELKDSAGKYLCYFQNATERILADSVVVADDSVWIQLPFFDSKIIAKLSNGKMEGSWIKQLQDTTQAMPFNAVSNTSARFISNNKNNQHSIAGRWAVDFVSVSSGDTTLSVGEFSQNGEIVTGTFLTPTGDYRYLAGIVDGDTVKLSCFDGGHAYLFTAHINDDKSLSDGYFYSGIKYVEKWTAQKNDSAKLGDEYALTKLNKNAGKVDFKFVSIDGDSVSIHDERFKNKVVLLQLMGSWCPNCMDETAFLSDYYNRHHSDGIEIIGLAYERSTNFERSQKTLRTFQKRFDVQYPMLVTGVTVSDTLRAEKTLPQLEKIIAFPTLIFLDKKGAIRTIHTGFTGPGTGIHYEHFKNDFDKIVGALLKEQ